MADGHAHVNVIIHKNFSTYGPEVLEKLSGAEGCVWALGISANSVSKSEYVKITYDYPLAAAKAFSSLSSPFKFVYTSGEGTTTAPGIFTPYFAVIEGQAEAALLEVHKTDPNLRSFSVRPALVDAGEHKEIHSSLPQTPAFTTRIGNAIAPVMRIMAKGSVSPTADLGKFMIELATGDGEKLEGEGIEGDGRTVTNKGFRRLVGI
ncbi:hypothetical protein MMC30_003437 [Trapelia coarctata]|nr:hypothetical protein [Trapelia coarctata]